MLDLFIHWPYPNLDRDSFARLANRFDTRLDREGHNAYSVSCRGRVLVPVFPWVKTAVPFLSLEWAIRLQSEGCDVEVLWDPWPATAAVPTTETRLILRTLRRARRACGLKVVNVPEGKVEEAPISERLRQLAFEALVRERGREPEWDDAAVQCQAQRLASREAVVRAFLQDRRADWLLLPGGVWGVSGLYWHAAGNLGLELTAYDSGEGMTCFQHGGPAAHFPDLGAAMVRLAEVCSRSAEIRSHVDAWVEARLQMRRAGKDRYQLQPTVRHAVPTFDLLVPLNYRLDTAAMCRQRIFRTVNEWLRAIVAWGGKHPEFSVFIRQHPCEKISAYRSREDFSWISQQGFPNVRFIAAEDPVNTYDLLAGARMVLPYSSRVGIEGAIYGLPVLLAGHAYYEAMPFVESAANTEDYFERIEHTLRSNSRLSEDLRGAARAAYFVAENFGLHLTRFTPQPADFDHWVDEPCAKLWSSEPVSTFLAAALERRPAADLLLEKQIAQWEAR